MHRLPADIAAPIARFSTLADWLRWQESLNPRGIELGLERVRCVAGRLGLGPFACPVITVAGTNGKGSSVALLSSILQSQGYRVCAYTSPHLLRYNERICVNGRFLGDAQLCDAFDRVESVRGDVPLTYFEFGTLAALLIFQDVDPQVVLLEVGLGGRLDAVNLIDADVALITQIGLDHMDWLGPDRESIGREKAGIMRPGRPVVCADPAPPGSIATQAAALAAPLYGLGQEFTFKRAEGGSWSWQGLGKVHAPLPAPGLRGEFQYQNAAAVIAVLQLLDERLPVSQESLSKGLAEASLRGRYEILAYGGRSVILDVAHNAEACAALGQYLASQPCAGETHAVLGLLKDKPARSIGEIMDAHVHAWYLGELKVAGRGQTTELLAQGLGPLRGRVSCHTDVKAAYEAACQQAGPDDRIVVFGSFHTVEAVLRIAE